MPPQPLPEPTKVHPAYPRPEWVIPLSGFTDVVVGKSLTQLPRPGGSIFDVDGQVHLIASIRQGGTFLMFPVEAIDQIIHALLAVRVWEPGS